ncbi:MSMEG_1061 family FMN-dependent PPOX-type flavoprotein [Streptomyces xanthophaeus]|uniref:MSMEG_1061 family FMN-dependent PPOX-type flavoprotein n=1 Tax=Streptomyces xanthophaeus TaxID=67385 RepID=UPI002649B9C0|nr:MSMEG_1061 family FMN-dependent PPOX-type flavoprotein [Streptomyces xanthophaeus]WKD33598.1 pyridoxamine 5'-phosphate oxidase family protein [Streptomyces xanthophaeus]
MTVSTPPSGRIFDAVSATAVRSTDGLRELYEHPGEMARRKAVDRIHEAARAVIGRSSLVFVASAGADGSCDVTPRGGPPGFVAVLDEFTLALPDATGNKRLDTAHNIVETGRAGLIFVIPGRATTLRVNGRACVSADPQLLEQLTDVGKPPRSAIVVEVEEAYQHCPKAFLRSNAWKPGQWLAEDAVPSSAEITLSHLDLPGLTIEEIRRQERESLLYRYE